MPKELESNPKYATAIQNLKINAAERLVSHFDVYSTLMDLLNWPSQQEFERPADLKQRSISLFRNISAERTCEEVKFNHFISKPFQLKCVFLFLIVFI